MMEGNQSSENLESHLLRVAEESAKRFPAEFIYARNGEICTKYSEILEAINYPILIQDGWRINIWKYLISGPLKEFSKLNLGNDVESTGQASGVFERTKEILDLATEEADASSDQIDLPSFMLEAITILDLANEELSLDELKIRFKKERRQELGALHKNYGKGLDLLSTINSEGDVIAKDPDPSTEIYWFMLLFGDYLEKMDSKVQVFDFVLDRVFGGDDRLYNFEAFKQLCKPDRIGFNVLKRRR